MAGRIHPLGAVAQLGERRVRNAKVRGSIPLGSTNTPSTEVRESPKAGANTGFFYWLPVQFHPPMSADVRAELSIPLGTKLFCLPGLYRYETDKSADGSVYQEC
jgi:hypothetical protein